MATKNKALTEEQKNEITKIVGKRVLAGFLIVLSLLGGITGYSLWGIYKDVQKKVGDLVAEQFKEPKIQVIVEKAAANQASVLMSEQINPDVVKFKEDMALKSLRAEEKLSEINSKIQDANRAVIELQLLTRFDTVVINAQIDDRDAFDQLWTWAEDISFPYQQIAIQTRKKILDESYTHYTLLKPVAEFPWREGLDPMDPNKFPLSNLWTDYKSAPEFGRFALVRFVWEKRRDISRKERLQFLVDVLKEDKSLEVLKLAGHYFSEDTGNGYCPLAIKGHLNWWEKNKETIK